MKKQIVIVTLLTATLGTGVLVSHAAPPPGPPEMPAAEAPCKPPPPEEMIPPPVFPFQYESYFLNLNEAQKKKLDKIFTSEHKKVAPMLKKREQLQRHLAQAEKAEKFDEAAFRSLAQEMAATQTDLLVSRIKMNREIMALLTPEQLKILRELKHKRGPHHRPQPEMMPPHPDMEQEG